MEDKCGTECSIPSLRIRLRNDLKLTWIDGGVCLNDTFDGPASVAGRDFAAKAAYDTSSAGVIKTERIANC